MSGLLPNTVPEIDRLRRCMNDLVTLMALPAMWAGGDLNQIGNTLLDVLIAMLDVDFLFVRLISPDGEAPIELARLSWLDGSFDPERIREAFDEAFGPLISDWPHVARVSLGTTLFSTVQAQLGLHGIAGVLVAGSRQTQFPGEQERLILNVASNQAAIATHEARRLLEQKRLAIVLDNRVAERTEELAAVNAALRRSQMLLSEGQRISLTGTFSWQVDTDEITFSEELYRIFDFTPGVVVTFDRITRCIYPDDLPLLAQKIMEVRSGGDNLDYEIRLRIGNKIKRVKVVGRVISHQDGITECIGAVQDITEQRLAEEARDKLRSELTQIARVMSLSTVAASIAHEVNQPLSGIVTNASTCLHMLSAAPPNIEGALETARRTIRDGNRAAAVVARLRALFKKRPTTIEPVDLNDAAREVVVLIGSDLQRNKIGLHAEFANGLPLIAGDRVQLQQVIMNLLRNAADAIGDLARQPREIIVRTSSDGDHAVRLTVEDTGTGIDTADIDRLFEAFHTTKADGMGIGLSVSRSIIEGHNGHIWAMSNSGPGATFGFSVPRLPVNDFDDHLMIQVSSPGADKHYVGEL